MNALTTSSTINYADGRSYRVSTHDEIAKVTGPTRLITEFDGEVYRHAGPLVAWFTLKPGIGWFHQASGRTHRDSVRLAMTVIAEVAT